MSSAELISGGLEVAAIPKEPLSEFRGEHDLYLCAEFANWPSDASGVLRFTRHYGILTASIESRGQFTFAIADWIDRQNRLRRLWDLSVNLAERLEHRNHAFGLETFQVENGEDFFLTLEGLVYRVKSLFRFIWIEFHCIPLDRLRKCRAGDCTTPYFVAKHLGQRYCSDICARSGQREWKKNWWKKRGAAWRHARGKKRKKRKKRDGVG